MLRSRTIFGLGVWLFFLPFLGIPPVWKDGLILVTAFLLLAASGVRFYVKFVSQRVGVKNGRVSSILPKDAANRSSDENKISEEKVTGIASQQ